IKRERPDAPHHDEDDGQQQKHGLPPAVRIGLGSSGVPSIPCESICCATALAEPRRREAVLGVRAIVRTGSSIFDAAFGRRTEQPSRFFRRGEDGLRARWRRRYLSSKPWVVGMARQSVAMPSASRRSVICFFRWARALKVSREAPSTSP